MLADYHVHSAFSDDSTYPMPDICRDAIEQGIDELCFTDHVDYGIKPDVEDYRRDPALAPIIDGIAVTNVDYERYFPAIDAVRERFGDRLTIRCGMEFGAQVHTAPRFTRLFDRYADRWDFIILPIHQVGDREFWNYGFQEGRTQQAYNDAYYQAMLDTMNALDAWSVLGHLDLIKRYDPAGIYPFERNRDIIAEILTRTIARGKGIEVNTSSFRYGLPDLQPCTEILRLYRDLGGRVLTIGSDSHEPEHLGAHIPEVRDRLRALGFTEFCTFEKMEPVFHAL